MDSWGDRVEGNIGTGVRRNGGENEWRDRIRTDGWGDRVERNIGTGVRRSGGENERRDGGTGEWSSGPL